MLFLKKIRVTILFVIVLGITMFAVASIMAMVFVNYLQVLKESSIKYNSESIREQTISFIKKTAKLESLQYSSMFEQMQDYSRIFATNIQSAINEENFVRTKVDLNVFDKNIYYNYDNPNSIIMIPKPLSSLSLKYTDYISAVRSQESEILAVINDSHSLHNLWIITKDLLTVKYSDYPISDLDPNDWKRAELISNSYLKEFYKGNYKSTYWTDVHESFSGAQEISVVTPIFRTNGSFIGLIGFSLTIDDILSIMQDGRHINSNFGGTNVFRHEFPNSFSFINDSKGRLIAYPKDKLKLFSLPAFTKGSSYKRSIYSGRIFDSSSEYIRNFGHKIADNNSGEYLLDINGKQFIFISKKIEHTDWFINLVIPEYDIFASLRETNSLATSATKRIVKKAILLALSAVTLFIVAFLIVFKKFLINPLVSLSKEISENGDDRLNKKISEKKTKEISMITRSLNSMTANLSRYMAEFEKQTSQREEIENEVIIASSIQSALLPATPGKEFTRGNFDIYGGIHAKEKTSKCFYDYFYISEEEIAFSVAEIAESGIPAAFYMGMTKTLIKNLCIEYPDKSPGKILTQTNKTIFSMSSKFRVIIRATLCYYNLTTKKLRYASTGETVGAYLYKKSHWNRLSPTGTSAIGWDFETKYKTERLRVPANSKVLLFAREFGGELSEELIKKTAADFGFYLNAYSGLSCKEMCQTFLGLADMRDIGPEVKAAALVIFENRKSIQEEDDQEE